MQGRLAAIYIFLHGAEGGALFFLESFDGVLRSCF